MQFRYPMRACADDNVAESRLGAVKRIMGRTGLLGHFNVSSSWNEIHVLSSAHLTREPGLQVMLNALRNYRLACSSGQVKTSPRDAFVADSLAWLPAQ